MTKRKAVRDRKLKAMEEAREIYRLAEISGDRQAITETMSSAHDVENYFKCKAHDEEIAGELEEKRVAKSQMAKELRHKAHEEAREALRLAEISGDRRAIIEATPAAQSAEIYFRNKAKNEKIAREFEDSKKVAQKDVRRADFENAKRLRIEGDMEEALKALRQAQESGDPLAVKEATPAALEAEQFFAAKAAKKGKRQHQAALKRKAGGRNEISASNYAIDLSFWEQAAETLRLAEVSGNVTAIEEAMDAGQEAKWYFLEKELQATSARENREASAEDAKEKVSLEKFKEGSLQEYHDMMVMQEANHKERFATAKLARKEVYLAVRAKFEQERQAALDSLAEMKKAEFERNASSGTLPGKTSGTEAAGDRVGVTKEMMPTKEDFVEGSGEGGEALLEAGMSELVLEDNEGGVAL